MEYICISTFVALACVAGLTTMSQALSKNTPSILPMPTAKAASGSTAVNAGDSAPAKGTTSSNSNTTSLANTGTGTPYISDMHSVLETAGGNGATEMMADQIRQIGQNLLDKGELTPEQANAFFDLANQGSHIASIEKLIEDANKSGNFNSPITFEGKTYNSAYDLAETVGWINDPTNVYPFDVNNPSIDEAVNRAVSYRSDSLNNFFTSYQTLKDSGALSNPQVSQVIGQLTTQIAYLSETTEYSASSIHTGQPSNTLQDNYISNTTYWKSDQICGGGDATGVSCQ
jgi:hypothetical protein